VDWGRFEGCFARLDRAQEHCVEFSAEWARYIEGHPAELSVHVEDSGRGTVSIVRYQPPPHRLSLLVGEVLYELRAALDNCLYESAVQYSGQDPPPDEGLLQFPIYDTAESWTRNLYRLRHLSDEHRAMLERIQPYQAQRQDLNCLRILNRLARNDRHRTLHVVGSVLTKGAMLVEAPPGSKVTTQHKVDGVIVSSHGVTEIASFTIEPWTPGQQVDVLAEIELEAEITEMIAERPWGSLDKRLTALHRAVFQYVEGLATYALGWTEPAIDENLSTRSKDATRS
jgi:hypothetical protein